MSEPLDAQRPSLDKRRREVVDQIAQRNADAHKKAKQTRKESDRLKGLDRGPNPR